MGLINQTKEFLYKQKSIKSKLSKFIHEMEKRLSYICTDESHDIHQSIFDYDAFCVDMDYIKLERIEVLYNKIIYHFEYETFDGFDYDFKIIYYNIYEDMSYDEIAEFIISESEKMYNEQRLKEIKDLEARLNYLKSIK